MTDKAHIVLPAVVELIGHGTSLGKSLLATTIELVYREAGYETRMIRIESRLVKHRGEHIAIITEDFAEAAVLVGGISAVIGPVFGAIKSIKGRQAVIIDWAGGQAHHRAEIFVATRFAERLKSMGHAATSIAVTTNTSSDMGRASDLLRTTETIAPTMKRGLALNHRRGHFNFPAGSEQARIFADLKGAAKGTRVFDVRAMGGESWKICDENGLSFSDVITASVEDLSARLSRDEFISAACQTEVAAWLMATQAELLRSLSIGDAKSTQR